MICLSFVVIAGFVGQVSLVQVALAGAAGFTVSHMAEDFGIYFPVGAVIGIAVATALGFLIGVSALRVRGVTLAVVTLAAAVAIEQFGFTNSTWGAGSTGSPARSRRTPPGMRPTPPSSTRRRFIRGSGGAR